jgi:hypothetical protein
MLQNSSGKGPAKDDSFEATCRLFKVPDAKLQRRIHEFRLEFELLNGPTDVTQPFVSTQSPLIQDKRYREDPAKFVASLPPFVISFLETECRSAVAEGRLDDFPDRIVALFVQFRGRLPRAAHQKR